VLVNAIPPIQMTAVARSITSCLPN
jgi:hypothetical protein